MKALENIPQSIQQINDKVEIVCIDNHICNRINQDDALDPKEAEKKRLIIIKQNDL